MTRLPESPARAALREQLRLAFPPTQSVYAILREPPPVRSRPVDDIESPLTASDSLEQGVDRGLERLRDALEISPERFVSEEGQLGAWRVIVSAAEKLLTTQVRVDQNRLRRKEAGNSGDILERLKQIEQGLPYVPTLELQAAE